MSALRLVLAANAISGFCDPRIGTITIMKRQDDDSMGPDAGRRTVQRIHLHAVGHDDVATLHAGFARTHPRHCYCRFRPVAAVGKHHHCIFGVEIPGYMCTRRARRA